MSELISLILEPTSPKHSIATVLADLSTEELERLATDVILEQRRRIDTAQCLFEKLQEEASDAADLQDIQRDYRFALLMMKAQHLITSVVIDKLGYVPVIAETQAEN